MARYYGKVGYGVAEETSPGVWTDVILERSYFGDVIRNSLKFREADKINNDLSVGNHISIVADEYANGHISAMRYVIWAGSRWVISDVEVERPRLLLRLGGVYNGPIPDPTP